MTEAEDKHNAALNEIINACPHDVVQKYNGEVRCGHCPARFVVLKFPRMAKVRPMPVDLDD